jgi:alpha-1,3-rhamnosyl/mannosyltransferase
MRVIINGIPLLSPRSGVGNYVYQNSKAMLSLTKKWDIFFYYGVRWTNHLKERPVEPYVSVRKLVHRLGKAYPVYRKTLDLLFWIGQRRRRFDLYHETNYIPMRFDGPTVLTIFDLSFHLYPETHPKERVNYMKRNFYSNLNCASYFITISEAVKQEMIKYLGLSEKMITVTPLGVGEDFKPVPMERLNSSLSKYGLQPGSYILCVGTLEPRKNITTLLKAYAGLPYPLKNKYPLVLAGGRGWLMEGLDKEIRKLGISTYTIKTGYIPKEDLPPLYNGANIFVYPSLYEGFGIPPLEAMACGTPVITSNVSSLPEVVGDAGIMIHPEDVKKFSEEMEDLLTNPDRRRHLSHMGIERAKLFTWERCSIKTLGVYDLVIDGRGI